MNTQTLKGNWNVTKGKLKQKYAQLTDNDLEYAEGREDELIGRIQKKVGVSRDEIERFFDESAAGSAATAEQRRGAADREAHVDRPLKRNAPTTEGKSTVDARTPQPGAIGTGQGRNVVTESRREGDIAQQNANASAQQNAAGQQGVARTQVGSAQSGTSRPGDKDATRQADKQHQAAAGNQSGSYNQPSNQNRNAGPGNQSGQVTGKPGSKPAGGNSAGGNS